MILPTVEMPAYTTSTEFRVAESYVSEMAPVSSPRDLRGRGNPIVVIDGQMYILSEEWLNYLTVEAERRGIAKERILEEEMAAKSRLAERKKIAPEKWRTIAASHKPDPRYLQREEDFPV
jgi:hypothetical protein